MIKETFLLTDPAAFQGKKGRRPLGAPSLRKKSDSGGGRLRLPEVVRLQAGLRVPPALLRDPPTLLLQLDRRRVVVIIVSVPLAITVVGRSLAVAGGRLIIGRWINRAPVHLTAHTA